MSKGKSRSVELMLLCKVPPSEACNPPAPNGKLVSELEKKNRAPILSLLELNSLSQFVVNWSSVYFPALLKTYGAVTYAALFGSRLAEAPGTEGIKKPLGSPNKPPFAWKSFRTSGSIMFGVMGAVAVLNASAMEVASRWVGRTGKPGLLIWVPGESALRCRVPW